MLLSGAVVGSIHDMSATYYNPGGLGYIDEPEILLSANAYQVSKMTVEDGAGQGFNLENSDFNPLPNMFAGAFRWKWLGSNKLAYSFLTRYNFDAEVRGGRVARVDVLDDYPGEEEFAGGLLENGTVKEAWAGLTWARGLSNRIGLGITQYLSIRSQSSESEQFAQAMTDTGHVALFYDIDNYSADMYSLLWKVGLGFDFRPVTVGITLTTPNVQFFGSGNATLNRTEVGLDRDNDGTPDDFFESDIQEGVTANYHSPLSIAAGVALHLSTTKIHLAAEWFDGVPAYDVLELDGFESQATGQTVNRSLRSASSEVLNVAAGVEHKFGEKYVGYLSFNTDYSAISTDSDVAVTGFDLYHVSGGTNVRFSRSEVMIGLSYAWGSDKITQSINLDPGAGGPVAGTGEQVDVVYRQTTFLIGFSVKI